MKAAFKTSVVTFGFAALLVHALSRVAAVPAQEVRDGGALKLDEFGRLYGCDPGARFDHFANALMENPGAAGHIVAYDARKGPRGFAEAWMSVALDYLVNMRGIEESRIVTTAAGRHAGKDLKLELWVVPPGAPAPARPAAGGDEPQFAGRLARYEVWNGTSFNEGDESSAGSYRTSAMARAAFAATLKRQADSHGYIVAYTEKGSVAGAWQRFATRERALLEGGLDDSRLTLINGGRREENEIELWITKRDAPPPVKASKREPALREAALLGSYTQLFDEDEGDVAERRWLLSNLADMLKADPQRVGCLVVFLEEDSAEVEMLDGAGRKVIDYVKIAEAWLRELADGYGVEGHRVLLRVGGAGEWQSASIETWIVPKGAPIPDPAEIVAAREAEANSEGEEDP